MDWPYRRAGYGKILSPAGLLSHGETRPAHFSGATLMLSPDDFMPVTLADRDFFTRHYELYPQTHSDNTFTNMVCWNHYAHYTYAYVEKKNHHCQHYRQCYPVPPPNRSPQPGTPPVAHPVCIRCKRCLLYTSPSPRDGLLSRMP